MAVISIPEILLPQGVNMSKWAVVACDQFTSEPFYWQSLETYINGEKSAFNLVYPEIYLHDKREERIQNIASAMDQYIREGLFEKVFGIVLMERHVGHETRAGILVQIDLDAYDWRRVRVPVRATEDTILERLPVRVDIRKSAKIELPHAIVLIDDREKSVIEPLIARKSTLKKLYDFDLNMDGGHITGYLADNPEEIIEKINALSDKDLQIKKYGYDAGIHMAVGDGNHSIAAAKLYWEGLKGALTEKERETHPARYLLCEMVNLYGGGMEFQPIHRAVFGAGEDFIKGFQRRIEENGSKIASCSLSLFSGGSDKLITAACEASSLIKTVQEYIEEELKKDASLSVDYIHNGERLKEVIRKKGGVGILLPSFPREELFNYVVNIGNLPKKAFSIGEPEHKRYYLEAKFIQ